MTLSTANNECEVSYYVKNVLKTSLNWSTCYKTSELFIIRKLQETSHTGPKSLKNPKFELVNKQSYEGKDFLGEKVIIIWGRKIFKIGLPLRVFWLRKLLLKNQEVRPILGLSIKFMHFW